MTIAPKIPEFGIEYRYNHKIVKELSIIYARLINQIKFIFHTLFSASFNKTNEEDQRYNEIELYINLKIIHNITESNLDTIDVTSQLKDRIDIQETKNQDGYLIK